MKIKTKQAKDLKVEEELIKLCRVREGKSRRVDGTHGLMHAVCMHENSKVNFIDGYGYVNHYNKMKIHPNKKINKLTSREFYSYSMFTSLQVDKMSLVLGIWVVCL